MKYLLILVSDLSRSLEQTTSKMKVLPRATFSLVFVVVTFLTRDVSGQSQKSKIVTTVLNTKWSNTPLVLEAAEFLAEENAEYFWDFLDFLSDKQSIDLKRLSAQEIYENVISFASRYAFRFN